MSSGLNVCVFHDSDLEVREQPVKPSLFLLYRFSGLNSGCQVAGTFTCWAVSPALFFTFLKQSRFATRLSCNLQFSWLGLPNADVTGRNHHLTVLSFRSVLFSLHLLLSVFLVSLSALTSLTSLCILPSPVARHSPHGHALPYAPSLDSGGEDWCHALGLLPGSVTSGGKCPLYSDGAHSRTCTRPWVSSPLP